MGLTVTVLDSEKIEIFFRLAENRNHKGTAFGGSQYTACALACYGLFLTGIREHGIFTNDIVISEGQIKYKLPVTGNFTVVVKWEKSLKDEFFARLKKKLKSRVALHACVQVQGILCAEFHGDFVAILTDKNSTLTSSS